MLALVPSFGFVSASQVNAVASSDYTVQAGDNLWNISRQHGISLTTLTKANNIDLNNYVILPGDLLHVPASNITITVGDNPIADAAKKVAAQKAQEAAAQQAAAKAQQEAQQKADAAAQAQQQAAAKAQQEAQQKAAAAKAQQAQQTQTAATSGSDLKSYVLNKMVAATGQSAATWDYIITRESRWQSNAQNPGSTAHGLFQSLWINGSDDIDVQIADAIRLYNADGMRPWAL
ncbi:LysM peptidoglycan-binding domain-containing protein [Lacticaseibacillus saniviri]